MNGVKPQMKGLLGGIKRRLLWWGLLVKVKFKRWRREPDLWENEAAVKFAADLFGVPPSVIRRLRYHVDLEPIVYLYGVSPSVIRRRARNT